MRRSLLVLTCVLAVSWSAAAVIPEQVPDLPVLTPETRRGELVTSPTASIKPSAKIVDGNVSDWIGAPTRYSGTAIYSAGEYIYQDYPNDDWGADDGRDAERLAIEDPLRELEPRTYRLDAIAQALGDEFGVEGHPAISALIHYGDMSYPDGLNNHADIEEVRVAADAERIVFLVRTHIMTAVPGTAVVILADTEPGGSYAGPGAITTEAEWAFVAAGGQMLQATYKGAPTGSPEDFAVATNAAGYENAIEVSVRRSLLGAEPSSLKLGVATGVVNAAVDGLADVSTGDAEADLINVAFRFDEPVRVKMEREQALALLDGSIDRFLAPIDLGKLSAGHTETFTLGPGYYDRIFESTSPVVTESESGNEVQGRYQHYGLYIPTSYQPGTPSPATFWLHARTSTTTHLAAAWVPGIIRQLGEARGNIIVAPSARGSSTWYVGKGHENFLETWDDAFSSVAIDPDRVYVSGHSMGGFGSYLVGLLYPDRFAAAFPIAGATTQGAWLGVGAPIEPQDGGNPEAELMFNIIENARNVPYVIFQGTDDELVWVTGVTRMALRFDELGYRNRLYLLLGQEHYSPLIVDEWSDAARYLDRFERDPNPARVTYKVWPALEHQVETVGTPEGATLDYAFDGAYWVDGLTIRSGDPAAPGTMGTFDATTHARGVPAYLTVPEAGVAAVGHTAPFAMAGLSWLGTGTSAPMNAFEATLTNIATAQLDVARMALATGEAITATVTTDGSVVLLLAGTWASAPTVTGATDFSYAAGVLEITIASEGKHVITITP